VQEAAFPVDEEIERPVKTALAGGDLGVKPAVCTRVKRPEQTAEPGDERCFGDLGACGRYRRFVARNGLKRRTC